MPKYSPLFASAYPRVSLLLVLGTLLSCASSEDSPLAPSLDPIAITTVALPNAAPDVNYEATLAASGGDGSYAWALTVGSPPEGLTLSADGVISGTPIGPSATFTVSATSGDGQIATRSLAITVNPKLTFEGDTLVAERGDPFEVALTAEGGFGNQAWSVRAGSLPDGLALETTSGRVHGVPTREGRWDSFIDVVSADGQVAIAEVSIQVLDLIRVHGTSTIRGTFEFDFDEGSGGTEQPPAGDVADVWWNRVNTSTSILQARNGARLSVLGSVDFDAIDRSAVAGVAPASTAIHGSLLPVGSVVVFGTSGRRFGKFRIDGFSGNEDMAITFVTFNPPELPGIPGGG